MEVYILDDQLRRETVVDRFESLVWTERFSALGDFQLIMHATPETRSLFPWGTNIAVNTSNRVMTVENIEDDVDSEGRSIIKFTGRSLERVMMDRHLMLGWNPENAISIPSASWSFTGTPGHIARTIAAELLRPQDVVTGGMMYWDWIPNLVPGSLYPPGTIPEPTQSYTMAVKRGANLHDVVKEICDTYTLGFRLYRGPDDNKLYFDIYSGNDRTTAQATLPAVVFSPDLENILNTKQLKSIENYKNVAYVVAKNNARVVTARDTEFGTRGIERRTLYVDASDIELPAGTALNEAIERRGQDELAKHKAMVALDGEISQTSGYTYGVDYDLGDLVELRDDDGVTNRMRVTEQIFSDDSQGEKSYPTLTHDRFITPGSWESWDFNQVWDSVPETVVWDSLP